MYVWFFVQSRGSIDQVHWSDGDNDGQLGAVLLVEFCIEDNSRSRVGVPLDRPACIQGDGISLSLHWSLSVPGKCLPSEEGFFELGSTWSMWESAYAVWCSSNLRGHGEVAEQYVTTVITKASCLYVGRWVLQTQCPQTLVLPAWELGSMENSTTGHWLVLPVASKLASQSYVSIKVLVPGCLCPTWR